MIRSVRPTDLGALLDFEGRGYHNAALAMTNLVRSTRRLTSIGAFIEQWLSLDENRQTWISKAGSQIDAVVSARSVAGRSVLEIDRMLFPDTGRGYASVLSLFDYVSAVSAENGVQRIFLRLSCESPVVDLAKRAGYYAYATERLYTRGVAMGGDEKIAWPEKVLFRRKQGSDEHHLFRLYNAATPGQVRQVEGLTLSEWKQVRDLRLCHSRATEFVVEFDGRLIGWLRMSRRSRLGQLEVLVDPDHEDNTDLLLCAGLRELGGWVSIAVLVPEYQVRLARILQEHGFDPVTEYYSLVKQLAARIRRPVLVPVRA